MKIPRPTLTLLVVCAVLTACNGTNGIVDIKNAELFTDESFTTTEHLRYKKFLEKPLASPVRISLIDTFLFIVDSKRDTIVTIHSISDGRLIASVFPRGTGPGEVLSIGSVRPFRKSRNEYWGYDVTSRRWIGKNVAGLLRSKNETERYMDFKTGKPLVGIEDPVWISDQLFICNDLTKYRERFLIYDRNRTLLKTVQNPYLEFKDDLPQSIQSDIFSTLKDVDWNRSRVVLAGRYLDALELYDTGGNFLKMLKGPEKGFDFKFDIERSLNRGVLIKSPESKRAYIGLRVKGDKIYALYSGKEKRNPEHYSYSNIIYTFDINGKPQKKYVLDVPLVSFDVDERNKRIYAIANVPEPEIVMFDIGG